MKNLIFIIFFILSLLVRSSKDVLAAVISLILLYLCSALLLILEGGDFVGLLIFIVYVGGICILFIFIIMLLNIKLPWLAKMFFYFFCIFLIIFSLNYNTVFPFLDNTLSLNFLDVKYIPYTLTNYLIENNVIIFILIIIILYLSILIPISLYKNEEQNYTFNYVKKLYVKKLKKDLEKKTTEENQLNSYLEKIKKLNITNREKYKNKINEIEEKIFMANRDYTIYYDKISDYIKKEDENSIIHLKELETRLTKHEKDFKQLFVEETDEFIMFMEKKKKNSQINYVEFSPFFVGWFFRFFKYVIMKNLRSSESIYLKKNLIQKIRKNAFFEKEIEKEIKNGIEMEKFYIKKLNRLKDQLNLLNLQHQLVCEDEVLKMNKIIIKEKITKMELEEKWRAIDEKFSNSLINELKDFKEYMKWLIQYKQ